MILLPAGPLDHPHLHVHERWLKHPRFVLQPTPERGQIVAVERARHLTNHERLPRRRLRSLGRPAGRMLDQELDERLPALPAIDATTQIRIERDRALDEPQRKVRVLEPARIHQRSTDHDSLSNSFCIVALLRFVYTSANRLIVAKRGENGKSQRQYVFSREKLQHS